MSDSVSESGTVANKSVLNDFDMKYNIINIQTPRNCMMSAHFKRSNAYWTLQHMLPVMITGVIDDLSQSKNAFVQKHGEKVIEEIKTVLSSLSRLKYQLQTDKCFELFSGNEPDKELWNGFLKNLSKKVNSFFRGSSLYAEAYVYRKLASFFEATTTLNQYDYFAKKKTNFMNDFLITEFIRYVRRSGRSLKTLTLLLRISLWSDLKELTLGDKDANSLKNFFDDIDCWDDKILINDQKHIWECLKNADHTKPVIVDIVCNNAGFELCADLMLAEFLIEMKMADTVRFHVKSIPWYVLDVTENDFLSLLDLFHRHSSAYISEQGRRWKECLDLGTFLLAPKHYFWTTPYEYYKMREISPDLYAYLASSQIIIFKGSLNYRKLLGDINWETTDEFITCIRGFQPTNICAITTLKNDLICGLSPDKSDELHRINPQWLASGVYSIIQYVDNIKCGCCIKK